MPTKISFRIYDATRTLIGQWKPKNDRAELLAFRASARGGGTAAYYQWWDEYTGVESRFYVSMKHDTGGLERKACEEDIQKYRDKQNPLKGKKPRPYRQGLLRGGKGFTATDFAKAGYDTPRTHVPVEPPFEGLTIDHEADVTTQGNIEDIANSYYDPDELAEMQAEINERLLEPDDE